LARGSGERKQGWGRCFANIAGGIAATVLLLVVTTDRAEAVKYRIQAQGGYSSVISAFNSEILTLDNGLGVSLADAITGDGAAAGVAIYADEWLGQNWTIGLEYLYSTADGTTDLSITGLGGASLPTDFEANFQTFFANAAYRVNDRNLKWHPFVGIGLGGGFTDIDINIPNSGSSTAGSGKVETPYIGLQGFIGFDYDISERVYLGTNARFFYIDGRIVDEDVQVGIFSILGTIGYRF